MSLFEQLFGLRSYHAPEPVYFEWTITVPEDGIRRIVREELADLVPVDVPDAPPEDLRRRPKWTLTT